MRKIKTLVERMRQENWVPLKYILSSCMAFGIDAALHLILEASIPSPAAMEIGAFVAWTFSSLTNFFVNRNWVFHSSASLKKAIPEYYSLAVVVFLTKSYVLLELFTRVLHLPLFIAKCIAEVILFVSNYFIQKKFIFKKATAQDTNKDK